MRVDSLEALADVHPSYADALVPITNHMFVIWQRYDQKRAFHLNSNQSRLKYIVWYLLESPISPTIRQNPPLGAAVKKALVRITRTWGPLSVFMEEVWRLHRSNDPTFDINQQEGYINFVTNYFYDLVPKCPVLAEFVPQGAIAAIQQPALLHDGNHFLSRGLYCVWNQPFYRTNFPNIHQWETFEAFTFEMLCGFFCRTGISQLFTPETFRYWNDPAISSEIRISRFVLLVGLLSHKFRSVGSELKLVERAEELCRWFADCVLTRFPHLAVLSGAAGTGVNCDLVPRLTSNRTRHHSFPLPANSSDFIDMLVVGPASASSGLGTGTRRSIEALAECGANFRVLDLDITPSHKNTNRLQGSLKFRGEVPMATLWHYNGEYLPDLLYMYPEYINPKRNIAYFFWETESRPESHELAFHLVDEIWTPAEFVRRCYDGNPQVPVFNVGTAVDIPRPNKVYTRGDFGLGDEFIFMFSFDSHSTIHRKNPSAVVRAFMKAFPNGESARLVLKTQNFFNAHWGLVNGRNEELLELCDLDSRIIFVNRTMSSDELFGLKSVIDCYVSLHRSEGFGYGPSEAMALGKPVIMTNYSANLEFATPDNCLLVDQKLIHILDGEYLYWRPEMVWADPDVDHAAKCMRQVYEDPESAREMGKRGREFISTNFSISAMAKRYSRRLDELRSEFGVRSAFAPPGKVA